MTKSKNNIEKHNCVDILIFNNQSELALQMRATKDKSFPGHWDFSAGGHVDPNEEGQKAAERETFEELGISSRMTFVTRECFQYPDWNPTILRKVDISIYKMYHNGPFKIDTKEVERVEFFSLSKIQKMIDEGSKFHPEFILVWKKGIVLKSTNI